MNCQLVSLVVQLVKNPPAMEETPVPSLGQKIPWRREWLQTPGFLLVETHEQGRLEVYSLLDHEESDTAEQLTLSLHSVHTMSS